ncbi:MAG: archaellin/type IV pilin N-terminal domain-containing protein [Candidatus Methanomethylicia archaeon]
MKISIKPIKSNKMGISPVIATVIIVAVTITVAVAISYWMGGIAGLYTRFEKIEITYAYATVVYDNTSMTGWNITLGVKNTGSADATIDNIFLNGVPISDVKNVTVNGKVFSSITVKSGDSITILITIPSDATIGGGKASSGLSLEIKLHTSAGKDYPKIITLP